MRKERRTCPQARVVLEPRFRPGDGWYLWCKKCEERYEERVKEVLKAHG